jgi:hypothetical protein
MQSIDWLRTADRMARRAERERRRQDEYRRRVHESASALRKQLPSASIADLERLERWAEVWMVQPISCGWRWRDDWGGWLRGYGPDLRCGLDLRLETTPLVEEPFRSFSPESIGWHGFAVSPLDCWISAETTLIAMSVRDPGKTPLRAMLQALDPIVESAPGQRRPPEAGVQILADDELFCPIDCRLQDQEKTPYRDISTDGGVPTSPLTLMMAFDPFVGQVDEFRIVFLPNTRDLIAPSRLDAILCSGSSIAGATKNLHNFPRIVDFTNSPGRG